MQIADRKTLIATICMDVSPAAFITLTKSDIIPQSIPAINTKIEFLIVISSNRNHCIDRPESVQLCMHPGSLLIVYLAFIYAHILSYLHRKLEYLMNEEWKSKLFVLSSKVLYAFVA